MKCLLEVRKTVRGEWDLDRSAESRDSGYMTGRSLESQEVSVEDVRPGVEVSRWGPERGPSTHQRPRTKAPQVVVDVW